MEYCFLWNMVFMNSLTDEYNILSLFLFLVPLFFLSIFQLSAINVVNMIS